MLEKAKRLHHRQAVAEHRARLGRSRKRKRRRNVVRQIAVRPSNRGSAERSSSKTFRGLWRPSQRTITTSAKTTMRYDPNWKQLCWRIVNSGKSPLPCRRRHMPRSPRNRLNRQHREANSKPLVAHPFQRNKHLLLFRQFRNSSSHKPSQSPRLHRHPLPRNLSPPRLQLLPTF